MSPPGQTYQVGAAGLRLHPALEVSQGVAQVIDHHLNLRQDGLKFGLRCKSREVSARGVVQDKCEV